MESVLVCVILLSLSGFRGERRATALPAPTVQVRAGEDATLQCPLLDASNASSAAAPSTLSWYRKAAGQSPQLLLSFRSTNASSVKYGSGVGPDKVSAAADGSLLLRGSQRSDAAVYYCAISRGGRQKKKATRRRR
ncbi:secreted immunoglobulin domain 1 [Siniperca chuatsi]|uniref:secreted immunoglobulin domain 1 n=1 Tax=Siniperca chuatsi TaxID=119488 RepID=UPI001CE08209|nr:secreted immunoglobulin domain 1 [Siniperca chuatsi]